MDSLGASEAAQLLYREADLLDRRDFDNWLELYTPDCVFWMPAWRDDGTQTEDPEKELSLIYYRGRRNLEDRVRRIRSGLSVASAVLPRVCHLIGNVSVEPPVGRTQKVRSAFNVSVYDVRTDRSHTYFGHYDHLLVAEEGRRRIASKVIYLLNDVVPTALDVYAI
jgi:3-phenylpropionate/cinnamic acid dioxygenase small subunit